MVGHEEQKNVMWNATVLAFICHPYCSNTCHTVAAITLDGINEFVT